MMAISDSCSYTKAFVNELFVQIVCGKTTIAIFANASRIRNIDDVQAAFA